jgi:L-ascorbate metabolism protein UlaG (beta-lactamase superfamily)
MEFIYYGHSCFSLLIDGKTLLFDPFISPNPMTEGVVDPGAIAADYILISHGHADHIADAVPIAKRTGAVVIASYEIHEWLQKQGITNTHPMNTGGSHDFGTFSVKCTVAQHSSVLPDGSNGGNPLGFIILSQKGNVYYSGDTALTMDMKLIPLWAKLNFAVLPIGDNFTMGAADALECAKWLQCKDIIGVHFDTFGYIKIDKQKALSLFEGSGHQLHLLQIGESKDFQ